MGFYSRFPYEGEKAVGERGYGLAEMLLIVGATGQRRSCCVRQKRPTCARKGIPGGVVAFLTESRKDLLLAAKVVGAQFGAHLDQSPSYSVALAYCF